MNKNILPQINLFSPSLNSCLPIPNSLLLLPALPCLVLSAGGGGHVQPERAVQQGPGRLLRASASERGRRWPSWARQQRPSEKTRTAATPGVRSDPWDESRTEEWMVSLEYLPSLSEALASYGRREGEEGQER